MENKNCCERPIDKEKPSGLWEGIVYAVAPHSFCILFIVFSVIGSVAGMSLVKNFLLNRNAFFIIFAVSIFFAVLSAILYLKRRCELSLKGARNNWKYLAVLFGTIIAVNFLLFFYVFPATANMGQGKLSEDSLSRMSTVELRVDIPCPGHAPLITSELKKVMGIFFVSYKNPDIFKVYYNKDLVSEKDILSQKIFDNFKATKI